MHGTQKLDVLYSFADVISIEKVKEHYRLLYNTKGRFAVHRMTEQEAAYKLCRVKRVLTGHKVRAAPIPNTK